MARDPYGPNGPGEYETPSEPLSQTVDQTRKDNELREESDDGSGQE